MTLMHLWYLHPSTPQMQLPAGAMPPIRILRSTAPRNLRDETVSIKAV